MVALEIPSDYKYVLVIFACTFFMNAFLVVRVAKARKLYDVQYPNLCAPAGHKCWSSGSSTRSSPRRAAACGRSAGSSTASATRSARTSGVYGGLISHLGDLPLQIALIRVAYDAYTTWQ
ncbi:leukotriene-C4 synthase [Aureococcus anophagefferens]|nr:leukotriene-C4 synthase [Aureococcus anophagefferens]